MKKKVLPCFLFFIFLFNFSCAQDETIQAGIKYNEASARIEAFKNVQRKTERNLFKNYLKDPDYKENIENIKNKTSNITNNRYLCPFYVNSKHMKDTLVSYSVTYQDTTEYTFYYNIFGYLIKFDKTVSNDYPQKIYSYSRYGNLISAAFVIDEDEQFIYDKNGKLLAHWEGSIMIKKPEIFKYMNLTRGENTPNGNNFTEK